MAASLGFNRLSLDDSNVIHIILLLQHWYRALSVEIYVVTGLEYLTLLNARYCDLTDPKSPICELKVAPAANRHNTIRLPLPFSFFLILTLRPRLVVSRHCCDGQSKNPP